MTKYNKKKMNRNKSVGINNIRSGNSYNNRGHQNEQNINLFRGFDDFDRMFDDFGMSRMDRGGLSGLDRFFGGFESISKGFRDMEKQMFSK